LYKSRNMVSIRVLQGLGIERAISYITKFGFQRDELPRNFSLALGTATVTPMEIAGAWSVFANGGYKVNPYVIERIESRDGQVLYQANPPRVPVEEQVAAP
ncbi:penicillin-binding transpeptidase domain-containing protein, partial [Morganella morganii]